MLRRPRQGHHSQSDGFHELIAAIEYVSGYLQGGNNRLAAYRDTKRPTFVTQEFAAERR
jgi:hypothetical protein